MAWGVEAGEPAEPAGRTRGRQARGIRNDARILDAAVATIAAQGVDSFGLRDVAARAGLTYGALYGRYANVAELLADLWDHRLAGELARLAEGAAASARVPEDAAALGELLRATPERRVMIETGIAAARVDELADVVPESAARVLTGVGIGPESDPGALSATLGRLALAIGSIAETPPDAGLADDAATLIGWMRASDIPGSGATPVKALRVPLPRFAMPDDLRREALLNGTLRVVARSGLRGATLRRIGRASGYAHTAVYQVYGNLDALLVDLVRAVAEDGRRADPTPGRYTRPEDGAARVAAVCDPDGRVRRRLILEFHLGATHDPRLAELLGQADADTYRAIADLLAPDDPPAREAILLLRRANRALQLGLAFLEETAGSIPGAGAGAFYAGLKAGAMAAAGIPEGR